MREQIRRFGRFALDMNDLPNTLKQFLKLKSSQIPIGIAFASHTSECIIRECIGCVYTECVLRTSERLGGCDDQNISF